MNLKVPYLLLRNGRPRWEPGPKLRREGWHGRDLKDERGAWLSTGDAIVAARALNDEVEARRTAGERAPRRPISHASQRTLAHLYEMWIDTPEFGMLRPKTRSDYKSKAAILLAELGGDEPVAALSRKTMRGLWRELYRTRGHHMASGIIAVAGAMLTHGVDEEWIDVNPALKLDLPRPPPRQVLWLPHELEAVVAAADAMDFPFVADAVIIAVHSGQREADVLAMPPRIFEDRLRLTQFKRGALIDAPMTRQLTDRVGLIRARWAAAGVVAHTTIVSFPLRRRRKKPNRDGRDSASFTGVGQYRFGTYWRLVRERAAELVADGKFLPKLEASDNRTPEYFAGELRAKTFQDLRDTAVTRLALADCTLVQISAITGHSIESINSIIKHYLALQPEMADAAIAKLQTWLDREGIAV